MVERVALWCEVHAWLYGHEFDMSDVIRHHERQLWNNVVAAAEAPVIEWSVRLAGLFRFGNLPHHNLILWRMRWLRKRQSECQSLQVFSARPRHHQIGDGNGEQHQNND